MIIEELQKLGHFFSKKEYFIFIKNPEYNGYKLPNKKKFIKAVRVKIIGIIPNPTLLFKIECKYIENEITYNIRCNSDELYYTEEECYEKNKAIIEKYSIEKEKEFEEKIKTREKQLYDLMEYFTDDLDKYNKLQIINGKKPDNKINKYEFLLRCYNAWNLGLINEKSILRGRNATEILLREQNKEEGQMKTAKEIREEDIKLAGDKLGRLAGDDSLYNIEQFMYLLYHPCPLCAKNKQNIFPARYGFCNHNRDFILNTSTININF